MRNSKHFCREDHLFKVKKKKEGMNERRNEGRRKASNKPLHSLSKPQFSNPLYFFWNWLFLSLMKRKRHLWQQPWLTHFGSKCDLDVRRIARTSTSWTSHPDKQRPRFWISQGAEECPLRFINTSIINGRLKFRLLRSLLCGAAEVSCDLERWHLLCADLLFRVTVCV